MNNYLRSMLASLLLAASIFSLGAQQPTTVFICTGGSSYAYHCDRSCRGLNRCTHSIIEVTEAKAQSLGRRSCKVCY